MPFEGRIGGADDDRREALCAEVERVARARVRRGRAVAAVSAVVVAVGVVWTLTSPTAFVGAPARPLAGHPARAYGAADEPDGTRWRPPDVGGVRVVWTERGAVERYRVVGGRGDAMGVVVLTSPAAVAVCRVGGAEVARASDEELVDALRGTGVGVVWVEGRVSLSRSVASGVGGL